MEADTNKNAELGPVCSSEGDMHLISGKSPLNFNLALFQSTSEELPLRGSVIILRVMIEVFRDAE